MKTVLVIDDLAVVRLYHTRFLSQKGYRCIEATNGSEGLELAHRHPVDLVLLDMVMPGSDGTAFLTALRADPQLAGVPVLAITSEATRSDMRDVALKLRATLLPKPLLPESLLGHVQAAIGGGA